MSKSRLEWRVGLFVFLGLLLLAVLLVEFSKGTVLFEKTSTIYLQAANVGGLKVRADVLMSGVKVGRVGNIQLAPDGKKVIITLKVNRDLRIYQDARFVIEQSGFLGDEYVAIMPTRNNGTWFTNGSTAIAEAPFDLQEVARSASGLVQRLDETAARLSDAIADVRRLALNEPTLTNLSTAVANMRAFSERALSTVDSLNGVIASNGPAISLAGSNLVAFSGRMDRFADGLQGVVSSNRNGVAAAVSNLESSTAMLKDVMADVEAGKGLVGSLVKNEQLAGDVSQIASNLSVTTSNLNRLGLWGILWQHKQVKTNLATSPRPLVSPKEAANSP